MKRIFLASLVIIITLMSSSCKKDKSTKCYISIKDITGFYRITKVMIGGADVTSTYMTPCRQSANLQLYNDKTAIYEETGASCTGTSGGTWDLNLTTNKISVATGGNIVNITDATVTSWDCSSLVVSGNYSGSDYQVTLVRYQIP
ncbi:hypothetical protein LK994_03880 [Ferruginibacter lapsinanis]|uniref:hypothetical protein n=1 Tax=Ferruginibacter lapsinanis TaxID=563172 RepID=UPI001E559A57|nr:hypothetical protein [Ferruginibacter lapsinanis]UEG50609.1 hypothetical protein LK994_03880 [Ferruginibacter lapsinanis]